MCGNHFSDGVGAPASAVVWRGMSKDIDTVLHSGHHPFCVGGMCKYRLAQPVGRGGDLPHDIGLHVDDPLPGWRPCPDLDSISPRVYLPLDMIDRLLCIDG